MASSSSGSVRLGVNRRMTPQVRPKSGTTTVARSDHRSDLPETNRLRKKTTPVASSYSWIHLPFPPGGSTRSAAARSPALATERAVGGDPRSTFNTAWDSRKTCHMSWAARRRLSPGQAGLPTDAALVPRDLCFAKFPPVAAQTIVEPATLARTTQAPRPARPQSGTTPRPEAVDECGSTLDSRPVRSCRRHDLTRKLRALSNIGRGDRRSTKTIDPQ